MSDRFQNLTKIPDLPAARMLADANVRLKTPLDSPASAKPDVVLAELESKSAWIDMLMLLGVLLPGRERTWWACLAARDYIGPKSDADPLPLTVAEAWVFKPDDDHREPLRDAMQHTDADDDTVHCARAALFAEGNLGPGEMREHVAPPGAAELSTWTMDNASPLASVTGATPVAIACCRVATYMGRKTCSRIRSPIRWTLKVTPGEVRPGVHTT